MQLSIFEFVQHIIFSNKPLLKNDKLSEQEMPRAAKDLFRRQVDMKKKSTMKKTDRKKKKQGTKCIWIMLIQLNLSSVDVLGSKSLN